MSTRSPIGLFDNSTPVESGSPKKQEVRSAAHASADLINAVSGCTQDIRQNLKTLGKVKKNADSRKLETLGKADSTDLGKADSADLGKAEFYFQQVLVVAGCPQESDVPEQKDVPEPTLSF